METFKTFIVSSRKSELLLQLKMKLDIHKIIQTSLAKFMHYGIRSVSMDDISRMLGISKKTLYQVIEDKKDLVAKCMKFFLEQEKKTCTAILSDEKLNAIEQLMHISSYHSQSMKDMNPSAMYDLQKYHPRSWEMVNVYKLEFIYNSIRDNMVKGQEAGYYRKELQVEVIAKMYITLVDSIMNPMNPLVDEHTFPELAETLIDYHLHAITTMKGQEFLQEIEKDTLK